MKIKWANLTKSKDISQKFEKRLTRIRSELLMIPDENGMLDGGEHCRDDVRLEHLCGLLHDQHPAADLLQRLPVLRCARRRRADDLQFEIIFKTTFFHVFFFFFFFSKSQSAFPSLLPISPKNFWTFQEPISCSILEIFFAIETFKSLIKNFIFRIFTHQRLPANASVLIDVVLPHCIAALLVVVDQTRHFLAEQTLLKTNVNFENSQWDKPISFSRSCRASIWPVWSARRASKRPSLRCRSLEESENGTKLIWIYKE